MHVPCNADHCKHNHLLLGINSPLAGVSQDEVVKFFRNACPLGFAFIFYFYGIFYGKLWNAL